MPQLILEYSSNILEKDNMKPLFQEYHSILEKTLPTDINNCKSRAIACDDYYIGQGQPNNAFIHISLKIMPGRDFETLKNTADAMMSTSKNHFSGSLQKLNLQITIEIIDLEKAYFKITSQDD